MKPVVQHIPYGFDHIRRRMAQQQGGVTHTVIEIFPAVHIPFPRAGGTFDIEGYRMTESQIMTDPTRYRLCRLFKQLDGFQMCPNSCF